MPQPQPLPLPSDASSATDFKTLHRKLERALVAIERTEDIPRTLELILDALLVGFDRELGLKGGRIYRREGDEYFVCCGFGQKHESPFGFQVPPDYPPHRRVLDEGFVIIRPGDPGSDAAIQKAMGVEATFVAIAVGQGNRYVIAFSVDPELREERVLYALTAVRHVINLKLEQREYTSMLEEARAIQESLLPSSPPAFAGYDIAATSRAAQIVGGDLFDYIPLSERSLAIAIADASGHGVGAALIARDALTGLRMLASEDAGIAETVEKLNAVVHRQALSSKFVSLFYSRLSREGILTYCNAGHNAPLLLRGGQCVELTPGGPVLGPLPRARYESGEQRLGQGDVLVMFTDGLVEQENASGDPFGAGGIREVLLAKGKAGAAEIVASIYGAVDAHSRGQRPRDDMTLVVVRRD